MPAQWTAKLLGKMHMNGVTHKQLANQLGYTNRYISAVMNGHREPKGAEQKFNIALDELIKTKR